MSEEVKPVKPNPSCTYNKVVKNYNKSFSMYAETDLDQPTDYSLRYTEEDSDSESDECNKISKNDATEFVQDTIKTYCTEDTPYETPFNFSTATSMSDLRLVDDKTNDKLDNEIIQSDVENKDIISNENKIVKSEFSSGLMSPEKPVNYCEEGTPGYFSRVPSFSSLNSIPVNENDSPKIDVEIVEPKVKETKRVEVKAVKFEEVVNYAEETPLMFSRSSSLASLDSIEQHSIHDDRSSVISDFSRLTSGLVSPSELPDSPTQTVPPSPKLRKNNRHNFPEVTKPKIEETTLRTPPKPNIFEDTIQKFKLESTPIQFSRATSLSSLTIDEHDGPEEPKTDREEASAAGVAECGQPDDIETKLEELNLIDNNSSCCSEDEDGDEDILAACINIGMQNNRYSQQKSNSPQPNLDNYKSTESKILNSTLKLESKIDQIDQIWTDNENDNLVNPDIESKHLNISLETNGEQSRRSSFSSISDESSESGEALLEECILSGMSKKTNVPLSSLSIKSNELTEAEQALLEQCILEGMQKSRLSPRKKSVPNVESNELTEAEQALLQQCIISGMQKNNSRKPIPSTSKSYLELTDTERVMLEECILEGMSKTRPISSKSSRRSRDYERVNNSQPNAEHTCCIHCPRNQQKQAIARQSTVKMKKKSKTREKIHIFIC